MTNYLHLIKKAIQLEIESMLLLENNKANRLAIKTKLDNVLEEFQEQKIITNYWNKCDEENNPSGSELKMISYYQIYQLNKDNQWASTIYYIDNDQIIDTSED